MEPTQKQIDLISLLQDLGAVIECDDHDNPDMGMFDSHDLAEKYIAKWRHLTRQATKTHQAKRRQSYEYDSE